jgi:hypothetical protein
MSGYPRDITFGDGDAAVTQPFLQKPIPPSLLVRTVEGVLSRRTAGAVAGNGGAPA